MTRPETLKRVSSFWLPLIEKTKQVPCLLLGNKIDLPKHSKDLEEIGKEIRFNFPFCQIMIETSAKSFVSISKIFEIAEQAVRFPIEALYDPISLEFTEKYFRALKLIFRLCDLDGDFRLNDDELNNMNRMVFGIELTHRELDKIKLLIKENTTDGLDHAGITFSGFIEINKVFIKKLKSENAWKILNFFKFNERLERTIEVVISVPEDSAIELSNESINFLILMFKRHSTHGMLTRYSIEEIFSTSSTFPWHPLQYSDSVHTVDNNLTVYSWVALWHLMMHLDPVKTIQALLQIGYDQNFSTSYIILKRKDLQSRRVHYSLVLGNGKVGKKLLIKKFLQKEAEDSANSTVCGSIEETEDLLESSYLILSKTEGKVQPDVVCLVYDGSSASINYIKKLNLPESTPRILMLNKNDSIDHESAYSFALEIGLKECPQFNLRVQRPNTLFKQLKDYAVNPTRAPIRRAKVKNKPRKQSNGLKWVIGGLVLIGALFIGNRTLKVR